MNNSIISYSKNIDIILSKLSSIIGKVIDEETLIKPSSLEAHLITSILRSNGCLTNYSSLKKGFRVRDLTFNADDSTTQHKNIVIDSNFTDSSSFISSSNEEFELFHHLSVGIDIVNVNKLFPSFLPFDLKTDNKLLSLFTIRELSYASSCPNEGETLAGLLAAKEALVKSKVCLMPNEFCEIEIQHDIFGAPIFKNVFLSISHDNGNAVAIAIPKILLPSNYHIINLFLYCDSLAFRRSPQSQDFSIAYPFIVQNNLLKNGYKVNLVIRGRGGMKIREFHKFIMTDLGYIGEESLNIKNIVVIQIGVVDAVAIFNGPFDLFKKLSAFSPFFANLLRFSYKTFLFNLITRSNKKIIQQLGRITSIETFVVGQPYKESKVCSEDILMSIDSIMKKYVNNSDRYIPINESEIDRSKIFFDGDHLTEHGHKFYGEIISKSILKQLS